MRIIRQLALVGALFSTISVFAQDTPVDLTGDLVVMYADDFVHHRSEAMYMLTDHVSGQTMRLRFDDDRMTRGLKTGSRVRVKGRVRESEVTLPANGESIQTVAAASVTVAGQRNAVVIIVNFQNAANDCTTSAASNLMFGAASSVDGLYQEMSGGGVWFTGKVAGPYTINFSNAGSCDYNGWASAADAAATAAGVNLSQFQHKIYVLPKNNPCSWAGLGTVGGSPSRAWIGINDMPDVYAHELGHNLGMQHSSTDANNDGTTDCEYCDNSDIMGYAGPGLRWINGPHMEQMGWIDPVKVAQPAVDGTMNLAPMELDPAVTPYPQMIKIPKPGTTEYYYFTYRRTLGYDSTLGVSYRDRTSVYHFAGGSAHTYLVTSLADSATFVDPTSGLTIRQITHNTDFATLQVSFSCSRATPTATLTGSSMSYTASLINQDSTTCGSSTFQLSPTVPSGWSASVSPAALTLAPGQTGQATVTMTAPLATAAGNYPVSIAASDLFQPLHVVTAGATCVVTSTTPPTAGDTTPPSAPANLIAIGSKKRIALKWGVATDNVRVIGYKIYRDGVLLKRGAGKSFKDKQVVPDGVYSYSVTAVDAAGNESAPSRLASVIAAKQPPAS